MNWPFWPLRGTAALAVVWIAGCATAPSPRMNADLSPGQAPRQFETVLHRPVSLAYLRYLPKDYDPQGSVRWPLLVFLHGAGERGTDLQLVTKHGPPRLASEGNDLPFVVISPQCPAGAVWNILELDALLDDVLTRYAVDPKRVYLTGLSMGGYGTWAWASARPERFAAVVPICGGGDPIGVWLAGSPRREALQRLPIWVFHGAKDTVVPLAESERMIDAFRRLQNEPRLTVYPDAAHDSWTQTYNDPRLYSWLLEHQLP